MPVKKTSAHDCCFTSTCSDPVTKRNYCGEMTSKILWTLVGVLLAYLIILVGTMIRNNLQSFYFIGSADRSERMITVSGVGKITATPDIAMTTIGMIAEAPTVAQAQEKNTQVMNTLINQLKNRGVDEEDIQTQNYNIYPRYNYTAEEGRELTGYQVNQSVTVKIRDLDKANAILGLAGEVGANSVSGLTFTIDDRDVYLAEARKEALDEVSKKAKQLKKALDVRFVEVAAYTEHEGGMNARPYYGLDALSLGSSEAGLSAPSIEAGSMDVVMTVNVTFQMD